jgi:hypothetical protein
MAASTSPHTPRISRRIALPSLAHQRFGRRALLGSLGIAAVGAAVGGPVVASRLADAATHKTPPKAPCTSWTPDIKTHGLGIFENVEDDRGHVDTGERHHIYPVGDTVRFDMTMACRDSLPGRQRNEVDGMRQDGQILQLLPGQTWRLAWDLFIPASLRATTSFTHIHQLKMPGAGSVPIFVMSLRLNRGRPTIESQAALHGVHVADTPLAPLQDHWIHTEFEYGIGNSGHVRWTLTDGTRTVVDATKTNVDMFLAQRVRPKWGIYRSLSDHANLRDCYMLTRNFSATRIA